MRFERRIFIDNVALVKQGDNRFGSVCLFVCRPIWSKGEPLSVQGIGLCVCNHGRGVTLSDISQKPSISFETFDVETNNGFL